jgi:O-antigen ligase
MMTIVKENLQFTIILMVWLASGFLAGPLAFVVVGISILLLSRRQYYPELFAGFWLILMLSDTRIDWLQFTGQLKVIYMLLLGLVLFIRRDELQKSGNTLFVYFIPFFVWIIIMVFKSPDTFKCIQKTVSYILLFLIVPYFINNMLRRDHRQFMRLIVYLIIMYLGLSIVMKYIAPQELYLAGRYRGFMGNPNGLGVLVALMLMLVDNFLQKVPNLLSKIEKIVLIAVIILSLYYCKSRSAIFALLLYFFFSRVKYMHGFLGFITFIVALISFSAISENLPLVISYLGLEEYLRVDTLDQASGRFIAWNFAWEHIQDHFFVGQGYTYTEYYFGKNYHLLSRMGHLGNAHNSFLTFWLDTGLIGLVLFVIPFVLVFLKASKVNSHSIPVLYAILFSANFESWLIGSLNPFTICLISILCVLEFDLSPYQIEEEASEKIINAPAYG